MGLNQEQVHSQEGPGEVVQPELLRDVMTGSAGASSSCCLVSPGLSVSWEHPPHPQQVSDWTPHAACMRSQGQKPPPGSPSMQECRAPGPSGESGAHTLPPLCPHHAVHPQESPSLTVGLSLPICTMQADPQVSSNSESPLVRRFWKIFQGRHGKEWQPCVPTTYLCI